MEILWNPFLNKPFKVKNRSDSMELNNFLKNHVLYGISINFWEKDKEVIRLLIINSMREKLFLKI